MSFRAPEVSSNFDAAASSPTAAASAAASSSSSTGGVKYPPKSRVYKRFELADSADVRVSILEGKVVTRISSAYDLEEQRPMPPSPFTWGGEEEPDLKKRKLTLLLKQSAAKKKIKLVSLLQN